MWERWVVGVCNRCYLRREILKERWRSMEMFRDIGNKMMIFQNNKVSERWIVVYCNGVI